MIVASCYKVCGIMINEQAKLIIAEGSILLACTGHKATCMHVLIYIEWNNVHSLIHEGYCSILGLMRLRVILYTYHLYLLPQYQTLHHHIQIPCLLHPQS